MMYKKMPKSDDQTILEMPERRSVRGGSVAIETVFDVNKKSKRLKEMLDQFQEKCIYKNNSIYDIWHIGATIMGGVFLQAQTCFTIYLAHRFFADPMVWVDATFALFILFLIKQELFCSSYLREAKYMFFKSLTMAGVLVDFDNSSLEENKLLTLILLLFPVLLGIVGVLLAVQRVGLQVAMITSIILLLSNTVKMKGESDKLQSLENQLLSVITLCEKDFIWAQGCFSELQSMTQNEFVYRHGTIILHQRKMIIDYLLGNCGFSESDVDDLRHDISLPGKIQRTPGIFKHSGTPLTEKEIAGLHQYMLDSDAGFHWERMRRSIEEVPFGSQVILKATLVANEEDAVGSVLEKYQRYLQDQRRPSNDAFNMTVINALSKAQKRKQAGRQGKGVEEPEIIEEPDLMQTNPSAIQQHVFDRRVSPQNMIDLQSILSEYPSHLIFRALLDANDNILRALNTVVSGIVRVRNNVQEIVIEEKDQGEYVFFLGGCWWNRRIHEDDAENVLVWIFKKSQQCHHELIGVRSIPGAKLKEFFLPNPNESDVRTVLDEHDVTIDVKDDSYDFTGMESIFTRTYFDTRATDDISFSKKVSWGRMIESALLLLIIAWMSFVIWSLFQHFRFYRAHETVLFPGYCGNDFHFVTRGHAGEYIFLPHQPTALLKKQTNSSDDPYDGKLFYPHDGNYISDNATNSIVFCVRTCTNISTSRGEPSRYTGVVRREKFYPGTKTKHGVLKWYGMYQFGCLCAASTCAESERVEVQNATNLDSWGFPVSLQPQPSTIPHGEMDDDPHWAFATYGISYSAIFESKGQQLLHKETDFANTTGTVV